MTPHDFRVRRVAFRDEYGPGRSHVWKCSRCFGSPEHFDPTPPLTEDEMDPVLPDCDEQLASYVLMG